jgi:surface polysaccharide O-acyltransferase-like enzyme
MALAQLATAARPRSAAVTHTMRLTYVDTLRTLVIAMVIVHHAGQAYGPTGGEWPIANPTRAVILEPFFTVNAAFGLGLLFLLAGYFVPHASDRKGASRFLVDRLIRLGLPLLFVSLVLLLPFVYVAERQGEPFGRFLANYLRRPETGHMWFVAHLILYSCGYAGWRWLTHRDALRRPGGAPSHRTILGYALGLALASFLVRVWSPIDRWVDPAPFITVELAHLPQYLSLFILGIVAYQRDWLAQLPAKTGIAWLKVGLITAALPYAAFMLREVAAIDITLSVAGGLSLSALVSSAIEALIAVGLIVGLLTLFRERLNRQGALARELASSSYASYVIHIFPVVGLQVALEGSSMPPLAKFGIVALLAVPLTFLLAFGLCRLPGVRRVM